MRFSPEVIDNLELALTDFTEKLKGTKLFTSTEKAAIILQREKDIAMLKSGLSGKGLNINPAENLYDKTESEHEVNLILAENVKAYYLRLGKMLELADAIVVYSNATPTNPGAIPNELKHEFVEAYQNTVQDHIALAKALLSKTSVSNEFDYSIESALYDQPKVSRDFDKMLNGSIQRLEVLQRYVEDPNSIINFVTLADETQKISDLESSPVKNFLLGGLKTLVGVGGIILTADLIAGSALTHESSLPLAERIGVNSLRVISEGITKVLSTKQITPVEKMAASMHKGMLLFGKLSSANNENANPNISQATKFRKN